MADSQEERDRAALEERRKDREQVAAEQQQLAEKARREGTK